MNIGIIGTGKIGSAIARAMVRIGQNVTLVNRRGPQAMQALLDELGPQARAATLDEAATADVVFVAVNWSKIPAALEGIGDWGGRVVVDANNPIEGPPFRPFDLGAKSSSEVFSELAPGARVVKAFNHLQPDLLSGDPRTEGGKRVLFLAGDDAHAKLTVVELMGLLGFHAIDLGALVEGGRLMQFPGGPLPALNLVRFA